MTRRALRIVDDAHFVLSRDNKRFLALELGNPDLRAAPGPANDTDLPIRIRRGDLRHIAAPLHETDARILGYSDPLHLTIDVVRNWQAIHPLANDRVALVKRGEGNAVAVVELAKADNAITGALSRLAAGPMRS